MQKFTGLTDIEVRELLKKNGLNEIVQSNKVSPLGILFRQVKKNFIVYLLVFAALISLFVGKDITAYTIFGVIFMVIAVGFFQEYRAERSINALKKLVMPVSIVIRNGKEQEVESTKLVSGDIVVLGNGEKIPADCEILEEAELRVDESILTGESQAVKKYSLSDPKEGEENLIFMGSFVVSGRCVARVRHTGMNTKFGKIANLISTAEKELPLQNKINAISKYMASLAVVVSIATGLLMATRAEFLTPEVLTNILILVIALSVSAFPEGFPVVLITTLATGAANMAKKNAIVNRMSIIETLGETTIICSDKTGTLTRGEMMVKKLWLNGELLEVTGEGLEGKGQIMKSGTTEQVDKNDAELDKLLRCAVICNNSRIERTGEDMEYRVIGTPTEGALQVLAAKVDVFAANYLGTKIEEKPFSSETKMMSVLYEGENKERTVYAKGAPEVLIEKCDRVLIKGKVIDLNAQYRAKVHEQVEQLNKEAFRTLALAYKSSTGDNRDYDDDNLILIGTVGIEDSPREEVAEAINVCHNAGIKVVMITGDNKLTAESIAGQIGLAGKVLLGAQLDEMSDSELGLVIDEVAIFARVRPEHKLRIVKILKDRGEVVTMTGDGVNDAPALKEAHIGVAMGKNGTDVSRSVADLTLKDDNFATIVEAIKEGRTIFNNIRKFVSYQLSCNLSELTILFFGVLLAPYFGWGVPLLLSLHILFMNLVTDNLPAITLGFNPSSGDIMREKPRKNAQILNKELVFLLLFNGGLMAVMTLAIYFVFFNVFGYGVEVSRTAALAGLILLEIASAFNFRSFRKKVLTRSLFVNRYLAIASVISFVAMIFIIYNSWAGKIFETVPLSIDKWLILALPALTILIIYDGLKEYSLRTGKFFANLT